MPEQASAAAPKGVSICGMTINHFSNVAVLWQAVMIVIYGTATKFFAAYDAGGEGLTADLVSQPAFLWTSVAVIVGLGYFFSVTAKHNWTSVGFTLAVAALVLQWSQLVMGFWDNATRTYHDSNLSWWPHIELGYSSLLRALYIVATILIALGATAGKVSALQALAIGFWGTIFATANYKIGMETQIMDAGGSMYIHVFGATFGLAASWALGLGRAKPGHVARPSPARDHAEGSLTLLATVLLFITLPVWNSGLVPFTIYAANPAANGAAVNAAAGRSFYNTVAALGSSVAGAYLASKALNGKFAFEAVQRAAIVGAAGVAATAPICNNPWGPMLLGLVVGFISAVGLQSWTPKLNRGALYDAAGVLNTSLIPGLIGSIASAIAAANVNGERGYSAASIGALIFDNRTDLKQGGYQMGYALVCFTFAAISGLLTGFLVRLTIYSPKETPSFDDADEFAVPEDEEAAAGVAGQQANPAAAPKAVEPVVAAPAPAAAEAAAPAPTA